MLYVTDTYRHTPTGCVTVCCRNVPAAQNGTCAGLCRLAKFNILLQPVFRHHSLTRQKMGMSVMSVLSVFYPR